MKGAARSKIMKSTKGFSGIGGGFASAGFYIPSFVPLPFGIALNGCFTTKTAIGAAGGWTWKLRAGRDGHAPPPGVISLLALGIPGLDTGVASHVESQCKGVWDVDYKRGGRPVTLQSRVAPANFCGLGVRRYAPEALAGMGQDSENEMNIRRREREASAPAFHGEITAHDS